ncbi:hypothetical protein ACR80S_03345 [Halomonas sp. MA07-2]|uniref:hypothetical protein n=1 Tax=unclassified Halomonas TaxID=2609666 RepID=UPI003EEC42AF
MAMANSNMDYNNCVANCKSLFPNSEAALVACINGCAKVNAPSQYGVSAVADQLQAEIQKLGKREFVRHVRVAAKRAFASLPDESEVEKLDAVSRQYIEGVSSLIETGLKWSDSDDAAIARFAQDLAWAKLSTDIAVSAMARKAGDGGGGTGPTCVTQCAQEYDKCVSENGCDTSGWICLCCSPCSLQYMGCVARCVTVGGGIGGIVIA